MDVTQNSVIINDIDSMSVEQDLINQAQHEVEAQEDTIEQADFKLKTEQDAIEQAKRELERNVELNYQQLLANEEIVNIANNYIKNVARRTVLNYDAHFTFQTLLKKQIAGKKVYISKDDSDSPYSMLLKLLSQKIDFGNFDVAILATWELLKTLAAQYFYDVFNNQYGTLFYEANSLDEYTAVLI